MRTIVAFYLLISICGCAASNKIVELDYPAPSGLYGYKSTNDLLNRHFTPSARYALLDIPIIDGNTIRPFVSGVNIWSNIASFVMFNGTGKKIIIDRDALFTKDSLYILIHEYVHHLDKYDRDGIYEFIDHDEFRRAFKRYRKTHPKASSIIIKHSDHFVTNLFGIGNNSELIAHTADWLVKSGGPDYMWHVYRHILIKQHKNKRKNNRRK